VDVARRDILDKGIADEDLAVPFGTVIEEVNQAVLPHIADKQFRTLAEQADWFVSSRLVPNFAKGGVQLGAPFGRKRFPMLRIPGTGTNRLGSALLGRKQATGLFNHMPSGFQAWMRDLGQRTGTEKASFRLAKEGNLWRVEAEQNMRDILVRRVLPEEALRPLAHGIEEARLVAKQEGMAAEEADKAVRELLGGRIEVLSRVPPKFRAALVEAIEGDAERGIDGIRQVFSTFYDAARRVGMDLGKVPNYSPLVMDGTFSKFLDRIAGEGVDVAVGQGSSDMANLGLAIIGRYLNNTGEAMLGVGARDLAYSQFAQTNEVTQVFRSFLGGVRIAEELSQNPTLRTMLADGDTYRLSADMANEAVTAALEDVVARNPALRKHAGAVKQAFSTDMIETFNIYVASMGEAIQHRDLIRRLRRVGLIEGKNTVIDVSNTLRSVKGRLSDDLASWIDDVAEGKGTQAASRMVNVKTGGRTFRVPATVAANPQFKKLGSRAAQVFSRFDRKASEIRNGVEVATRRLVEDGYPEELATRLAFASADTELADILAEVAEVGLREADTLQTAALEMAARGVVDQDTAVANAIDETRRLIVGTQETIDQMEAQARRALNLPDASRSESVVDLLDSETAPKGFNNTLEAMARWALESAERRVGRVTDQATDAIGQPSLRGASRQQMAKEAVSDLADRALVSNLTVGQLAEFASPRVAARIVAELNGRLIESGYEGMLSLTDDILEAAEDVFAAEYRLFTADEGIEAADAALRASETILDEAAVSLRESDELLGPALDHAVEAVADVNDAILISPVWRDVWAAAIHKQGGLPRGQFAQDTASAVAKGLDPLSQKQLTGKGAKGVAREAADIARGLWAMASTSEARHLEARAKDFLDEGASPIRRAIEAMMAGDTQVLAARPDVFRTVVGSITDRSGRALFDPDRFVFRPNGQIVYEPTAPVWITLDDVADSIRQIAATPNTTDMEALAVVKATWEETPEVIEAVDPRVGDFFRQVDSAGGLPFDVEEYEYLRRFVADLDGAVKDLASPSVTPSALTDAEDQIARRARSNWNYTAESLRPAVRALLEGGEVADEVLRGKAQALMKWWSVNAESPGGLMRALNAEEIDKWSKLGPGEEFVLDMASSDVGGVFAQQARKGAGGLWTMEFADHTRAARNDLNQIEAARGGDEWLVSGHFKIEAMDEARQVIRVTPTRDAITAPAPVALPGLVREALPSIRKVLDSVDDAFRTGNSRKLTKLWAAASEELTQAMPPDEISRLTNLVGKAEAVGEVADSRFGDQWRSLLGSADDAADGFAHDVAMLRRQSWDLGEEWAGAVAQDAIEFRSSFQRLLGFADDLDETLRAGFQPLEELGGEFDEALSAVRQASSTLRKGVGKAAKDRRLTGFLPELPEDVKGIDKWLRQMEQEMARWEPIKANTAAKGFISPKVAALGGESLEGLQMTPGVALMFDHIAAGSIAVASPMGVRLAAEAYREIEKWWKAAATVARPTFVPRNVFSGAVNGLLVGVGPRHYAAVRTHVWSFRRNLDELGVEGAIKELPENFQPYMRGLWDSGLLSTSFSHTLDRLKLKPELGQLVNPLSSQNAIFRAGGAIMETSEDFLRAAAFIRWFDPASPSSAKLAKEMALAVHFDYTSLTRMETAVKRFVPFFVWTRRNLPLQMRALVEQPGHVMRLHHIKQNVNAETEGGFVDEAGFAQSPWLSSFAIKTPFIFDQDTPYWQRLMLDPQVPVRDLEEALNAFSDGPAATGEWLIRSLSPAFSSPIEIFDEYDTVAPTGLREILMGADAILPGEGVAGYEPVLGGQLRGPAFASNLFSTAIPFLGEWTRLAGIRPSSGTAAARGGFNVEDGITADERIKASALGFGRAIGATLQTPSDTRSSAFDAIYGMEDEIEKMKLEGKIVRTDDIDEVIATLLRREGIDPDTLRRIGLGSELVSP
jgi:hypothetical protein